MHSIYYNYALPTFANSWKKNTERNIEHSLRNENAFTVPKVNLSFFKRFPLYTFPNTWNEAGDLKFYQNPTTFKIQLRYTLHNPLPALPLTPPFPPTQNNN